VRVATKKKDRRASDTKTRLRDDLIFKALANADRRDILDQLRDSPKTTGQLCKLVSRLDRCTVMLHLKIMEEAELIIAKKKGRFRWNYLNVEPIQRVYDRWIKGYAQPAAELLTRLKDQLEND
jgi:DNA-binding transcriptional ArsR family regulator